MPSPMKPSQNTRGSRQPKMNKAGVPLKLQAALDQLSKKPSPAKPAPGSLAEWEERNEGWIDRALSGQKAR